MNICDQTSCTGCGVCTNICPVSAVSMNIGQNGFVFPVIDNDLCVKCGKCIKTCPANQIVYTDINIKETYAAWNKNKRVRKRSSSGGIFSLLAESILDQSGIVAGVAMQNMEAKHITVTTKQELYALNGSKYVQSNTGVIYKTIKKYLEDDKIVLFSGTPCQVHALKLFLGKEYANLFLVDVVCHGVPNQQILRKHLEEVSGDHKASDIKFRYKDPFWDFSYVKIEYLDHSVPYQKLTVDDDYFHLFNLGYSIRNSCHACHYANTYRQGDITLADFWGYRAHNFSMNNYFGGISLILVNNDKGKRMLNAIKTKVKIEAASLDDAKRGNKCLTESFSLPDQVLKNFWNDYNSGMSLSDLSEKFCPEKFKRPDHLRERHFRARYAWIKVVIRGFKRNEREQSS